jgi:predicted nucleotidyltransferase component of viral defense system
VIPQAHIVEWRAHAPWISNAQIEQDLIISQAIVLLFSHELFTERVAFRGGTALHKLYLHPALRYSEDIDLVQLTAGPAGPLMDAIQQVLNPVLGTPRRLQKEGSVTLIYRAESEIAPVVSMKVKVEMNTREHFTVEGLKKVPFAVKSRWFSGSCNVITHPLTELLGTKLRALYQRRKGRDLYDLWLGITRGRGNPARIVDSFNRYMDAEGHSVSIQDFRSNLAAKMSRKEFLSDTDNLLRSEVKYDPQEAYTLVDQQILTLLKP